MERETMMRLSEYDMDTHEESDGFVAAAFMLADFDPREEYGYDGGTVHPEELTADVRGDLVYFAPVGSDIAEMMVRRATAIVAPEGEDIDEEWIERVSHGVYESDMDYDTLAAAWNESKR